ncbi:chemotaxis protein histidine kinase CheA [Parabacteroides sp. PFB2-12]|uniref:DUF3868 domain-containing protein n=1 Tax=unclassified Parabacteroides TaxID=2649774 RepID=UPI0024734FAC|nr:MULTISPECIES: DUF3868 domain-containing protein [unclassified Parabacteroides]MDH6389747.1 chemotaxis protein histidine kinase CheA [Parabacteroides sp. PFB2-12]
MKTNILITLCLLVASVFSVQAQQTAVYKGKAFVEDYDLFMQNDSAFFQATICVTDIPLVKYHTLTITPVLCSGSESLELAPIVLQGGNKDKYYRRAAQLSKGEKAIQSAYVVWKNEPKKIQVVKYKKTLLSQPWMEDARLVLKGTYTRYHGEKAEKYSFEPFLNIADHYSVLLKEKEIKSTTIVKDTKEINTAEIVHVKEVAKTAEKNANAKEKDFAKSAKEIEKEAKAKSKATARAIKAAKENQEIVRKAAIRDAKAKNKAAAKAAKVAEKEAKAKAKEAAKAAKKSKK